MRRGCEIVELYDMKRAAVSSIVLIRFIHLQTQMSGRAANAHQIYGPGAHFDTNRLHDIDKKKHRDYTSFSFVRRRWPIKTERAEAGVKWTFGHVVHGREDSPSRPDMNIKSETERGAHVHRAHGSADRDPGRLLGRISGQRGLQPDGGVRDLRG